MSRTRPRTDLEVVRQALDLADAHGMYHAAKTLGLHHRTVQRWMSRRRDREHPAWPTAEEIAAWRVDEATHREERRRNAEQAYKYRQRVYLNRGPLQVPALGTTRRLQALSALGWTQAEIADRLGVTSPRVGHLMNGLFPTVFPATAAAVEAVYEQLCMIVPTDPAPAHRGEIRVHQRTRRVARDRGWFPPLAWDNIDDPDEQPRRRRDVHRRHDDIDDAVVERLLAGDRVPSTRAEKEEVVRRWTATGRPLVDLEALHGWKPERYVRPARHGQAS